MTRDSDADKPSCFRCGVFSGPHRTLRLFSQVPRSASPWKDGRRKVTGASSTRFRLTRMSCGGIDMGGGRRSSKGSRGLEVAEKGVTVSNTEGLDGNCRHPRRQVVGIGRFLWGQIITSARSLGCCRRR